ncbi:MAG: DUF1848 family protein [candidate division Zixibacteria bacterium]|nr:DUF1848 family protein [candidate division Zixibacteria bacterium]
MISLNKIPRLIVSVAQKYGKSEKRMKKMGLIFLENYQVKAEEFITAFIAPKTSERGIVLSCCVTPYLTRPGCIDSHILSRLRPDRARASSAKDRSQREYCNCTKSHDIGKWFSCGHGCVYCYGNPALSPPKG